MTTIAEIETWPAGTPVDGLAGKVAKVFRAASGTRKDGNPWVRQDFILNDGQKEISVKWWDPGDRTVTEGQYVEVTSGRTGKGSKVDLYEGKRSVVVNSFSLLFPQGQPVPATPVWPPQGSGQERAAQRPGVAFQAPGKPTEVDYLEMLGRLVEGMPPSADPEQTNKWVGTGLVAFTRGDLVLSQGAPAVGPLPGGELEPGDDDEIPF